MRLHTSGRKVIIATRSPQPMTWARPPSRLTTTSTRNEWNAKQSRGKTSESSGSSKKTPLVKPARRPKRPPRKLSKHDDGRKKRTPLVKSARRPKRPLLKLQRNDNGKNA